MPQISIITPAYIDDPDKLVWLSEMLQSLQAQSISDWECIVIDDCSPLLIGEVKLQFANDKRIRWLKNAENYGPAMTRNSAVAIANSDCILPLDADDKLANPQALERLYQAWEQDKTKTVYGNLQVLQAENGNWQFGKTVQLAEYSFENAMILNGVMPVTVMHSREAWLSAGGWKPTLQHGREDVEYWISCGKAGYCGKKINHTTLLYRKHEQSRDYRLKYMNNEVDNMNNIILDMHADVYKGEYPMGCCGKGNKQSVNQSNNVGIQSSQMVTTLDQFGDHEKVWGQYAGKKTARFDIIGRTTRVTYTILGPGHKFEIHLDDVPRFRGLERGAFRIGVPAPIIEPVAIEAPMPEQGYQAPEPELATLERLDTEPVVVEATPIEELPDIGNHPIPNGESNLKQTLSDANMWNLGDLDIGKFTDILMAENWTIAKLAEAKVNDLTPYRGIGEVRAAEIIETAKNWLEQRQ